jgi:MarR family transcriptional regulator, multiple antibiotic resistance protein MarR
MPRRAPRPETRLDPSERAASDALWDELRACHRRVRAELRSVVLRRGLYLSEYRALNRLAEGPRTPSHLADELGLAPASITDLAAQLVGRGWAVRAPHPTDRRAYFLRPTRSGRAVRNAARQEYRTRLAEVYAAVPAETREALVRDLGSLAEILEARAGAGADPPSKPAAGPRPRRRPPVSSLAARD